MDLSTFHMRRLFRLFRLVAVLGVLAVAGLSACGGEENDDEAERGGSASIPGETQSGSSTGGRGGGGAKRGNGAERGDGASSGPAFTGDVEQAREGAESVDDVYEGFSAAVEAGVAATEVAPRETLDKAAGNESLTKVCDLMSEEAKQQTIVYAKRSAGLADVKWNCENATGLLLRRASQRGGLKKSLQAKIVGVNVEGDNATASVRFGGKGPISTISLVKEDGEWKLAASPSGGGGK